jgi:N,N'-diacetylchitobiose transport system substrate-binding protein
MAHSGRQFTVFHRPLEKPTKEREKMKRYLTGAASLAAAIVLSGCAGSAGGTGRSSADEPLPVPTITSSDETITVWSMNGDYSAETLDAINAKFTEVTGAEVTLEIQEWEGITTKVPTALSTSNPPDVLDLGNTQIPGFAANGGLMNLTPYKEDLQQGRTWLAGLEDPATVDGELYGVPGFGGGRAVVYNKKVWKAAGVTDVPATYDELTAALDTVRASNTASDFAPFYLPGQNWYAGVQWIWDAGGEIATQSGDVWESALDSAEAQQGLEDFKEFQNKYSTKASQTVDTKTPSQQQLFADGKAGAIFDVASAVDKIIEANPRLSRDDLGSFPFPGKHGELQPVRLGGSDWSIAAKSQNKDLALVWIKIATSSEIQKDYVYGKDGWIPNNVEDLNTVRESGMDPLTAGFFEGVESSQTTPVSPNWPTIEGDRSVYEFFQAVVTGSKSPERAAQDFGAHLESVLNDE